MEELGMGIMMTFKRFAILFVCILFAVTGQMLLKNGMNQVGEIQLNSSKLFSQFVKAYTTPSVVLGLFVFVMSSVLWLVVLSKFKLSMAYPMVSFGYVLTVILSYFIFKEHVPTIRWFGLVAICAGVVLIGLSYEGSDTKSTVKSAPEVQPVTNGEIQK